MTSQEDMDSKSSKGLADFIVHRPWTVGNVMFAFCAACYIPGMKLPKEQEVLAIPGFDMELVGDFDERAISGDGAAYYMLWCKGCDMSKHPEYVEDRGRALRVLQKVKEKESKCRDMTWFTSDDPGPRKSSEYFSASKNVAYIYIQIDGSAKACQTKLGKEMRDLKGQSSGDVHGGLYSYRTLLTASFNGMTKMFMEHQIMLIPILLLLMWNACGGWWRSLTNIIISGWAAGASQGLLLLLAVFWPDIELGFMGGGMQFISLAFCTDYSIFFWTRLQKEREENPEKEKYLQCVVEASRKSSEVIICSSLVMFAAYMSTSFYPRLDELGFMAMNIQFAIGMALCGFFSVMVTPAWAAALPSLFDNREPNNPNILQRCLPAMMTALPEGKQFWKTWTGIVTRGKMMIIIPILAYAVMAPFVYCLKLYEPNYNQQALFIFPGLPESDALEKMTDHFGTADSAPWIFRLKATEIGPANKAAMLQLDDVGAASTAEEVAFAQHAMKMSRKVHGNSLGDEIVMQPEFGKQVCQFSEDLQAIMKENHYQLDATKIETVWYGKDPFGGEQHGCRSQDQISDGLRKAETSFDSKFGRRIHKSGDKMLVHFYPGLEPQNARAKKLYHLLRDVFEKQTSHEFAMNGKRYWFEAEHSTAIAYLKESGAMMKKASPWIMGFTAGIAFLGVAIMFKSFFLPLKFVLTIVVPIAAVFGLLVSVYQENWFGTDELADDGGVSFYLPYIQMAMVFGLAMDYDIFLFARVYEYRQDGYDNVSAVQKSLVETGPVVTTAGTFMCVSFFFMMMNPIMQMSQVGFLYFMGVFVDTYLTCTCIAPCVLCWGEWLNFFPGYIPPVTKKYNVDEGCDEGSEPN